MRDYRSKEMRILIAAVLCAVICLTAISFSISSIRKHLNLVSTVLLGGDRIISAPEAIEPDIIELAKKNNLKYTQTLSFYSMLATDTELLLAAVKAVTDHYPLLGQLKIAQQLDAVGTGTNQIPSPGTIWLESRAMIQLGIRIGDSINVGDASLVVTAILSSEPDQVADGISYAPRAIMNMQDVASTQAVQPGSRVTYKLLVVGSADNLHSFDMQLNKIMPVDYKVRTINSESNSFNNLNLAENYLNLAALVNILLAAVAVSIAANRYSTVHVVDAAIMRCLGASGRQIILIYSSSLLLGSIVLGLVGSGIGFAIQQAIAGLLVHYINLELPLPGLQPLFIGICCALILVMGVALPAIIGLAKVPPMQILRSANNLSTNTNWGSRLKFSRKLPALLRLSLNNIVYNLKNNIIQVLAFAIVICVALILFVIRTDLLNSWQTQLPKETPNYFAINIPTSVVPKFKQYLIDNQITVGSFYPIVRGTLIKINQEPVSTIPEESGKRTGIHRPLNLTWTQELPFDNKILQGEWFSAQDVGKPVLSIEKAMAERLNVGIGDELTFMINTQEIHARISNIRSVQWDSFTPNFYVIYPAGVLEQIASTSMTSFYMTKDKEKILLELVKKFPQINLLSVTAMLDMANVVISLLSLVVGFVWLFTLLVGILLLLAVILSNMKLRNYQNNLMRILGASIRQVQSILLLEYIVLGAIAGLLGSGIAVGVAQFVSKKYFAMYYQINWWNLVVGCIVGVIVMLVGGVLGTRKSLNTAPIQLTRDLT